MAKLPNNQEASFAAEFEKAAAAMDPVKPESKLSLAIRSVLESMDEAGRATAANILDIPAAVPFIAGLPGALMDDRGFIQAVADPNKETFSGQAIQAAKDISNWADRQVHNVDLALGYKTPADPVYSRDDINPLHDLAGIMGSAVVGVPKGVLSGAGRLLPQGSDLASKAIRGTAKVAEVVTPVTLPATRGNIAANMLASGGIHQGISAAVGAPTIWNPNGDTEEQATQTAQTQEGLSFEEVFNQAASGQTTEETTLPFEEIFAEEARSQEAGRRWLNYVAAAGVAGVGSSILRYAKPSRAAKGLANVDFGENPRIGFGPKAANKVEPPSPSDFRTAVFDSESLLKRGLKEAMKSGVISDAQRKMADANIITRTRLGGAQQVKHTLESGMFIDHPNLHMPSIMQMKESLASLPEALQKTFNDGMFAADELEARRLSKAAFLSGKVTKPLGRLPDDIDDATLQAMTNALRANPQLAKLEKAYRDVTETLLRYRVDEGTMTPRQAAKLRQDNRFYMPREAFEYQGFWQKLKQSLGDPNIADEAFYRDAAHFAERNLEGGTTLRNVNEPMTALENYATTVLMDANRNRVQREWIDIMKQMPGWRALNDDPRNVGRAFKVDASNPKHKNYVNDVKTVSIARNGEIEKWHFYDPDVATAMKFFPHYKGGMTHQWLFDKPRRLFQETVTGIGQPFFAAKSVFYDALLAPAIKDRTRALGVIDGILRRTGLGSWHGDPTTLFSAVWQVPRDVTARGLHSLAQMIKNDIGANATWVQALGPNAQIMGQPLDVIADRMLHYYAKTTRGMLEAYGGYNAGFMTDPSKAYSSLIHKNARRFSNQDIPVVSQLFRAYRGTLEAVHNSTRAAYFAANYKKGMSPDQIRKLVAETRELVGDFSRSGSGKSYRMIQGAIPYGNVTVQATSRLAQAMKDDFTGTVFGLASSIVLPSVVGTYLMSFTNDEIKKWWSEQPEWLKVSNIPLPAIGAQGPEDVMLIPVPPELIPIKEIGSGVFLELLGKSLDMEFETDMSAGVNEALAQFLGLAPPPVLNAMFNVAGTRLDTGAGVQGLMERGDISEAFSPIFQQSITGGEIQPRLEDDLTPVIAEMFNSLMGTTARMFIATHSAAEDALERGTSQREAIGLQVAEETRKRLVFGPQLFGQATKYRGNEVTMDLRRKYDKLKKLEDQARIETHGTASGEYDITDPDFQPPKRIVEENPQLAAMLVNVSKAMSSGGISALRDEIKQLQGQREMLQKRYPQTKEGNEKMYAVIGQINDLEKQVMMEINRIEQDAGMSIEELLDAALETMRRPTQGGSVGQR